MIKQSLLAIAIAATIMSCAKQEPAGETKLDSATSAAATMPEPIAVKYEYYGDSIATNDAISTADLLSKTEGQKDEDTLQTRITGEIIESCANKGCWVSIKAPNNEQLTMRFKGYKFFVPTSGLEGKTLVADGISHWVVNSVADLKKEAKEEGKSKAEIAAITKPERYLEFTASGVAIAQ
jgi:hypothetical protein